MSKVASVSPSVRPTAQVLGSIYYILSTSCRKKPVEALRCGAACRISWLMERHRSIDLYQSYLGTEVICDAFNPIRVLHQYVRIIDPLPRPLNVPKPHIRPTWLSENCTCAFAVMCLGSSWVLQREGSILCWRVCLITNTAFMSPWTRFHWAPTGLVSMHMCCTSLRCDHFQGKLEQTHRLFSYKVVYRTATTEPYRGLLPPWWPSKANEKDAQVLVFPLDSQPGYPHVFTALESSRSLLSRFAC